MPKQNLLFRYSLIIKRLQKGPVDFSQLSAYLERESEIRGYDYTLSLRTFQREIKEIEKLGYEIKFDKSQNVYFIAEVLNTYDQSHRLLEAFETLEMVQLAQANSDYVQFEKRYPKGLYHFQGLLHAIKNHNVIRLNYQKFHKPNASNRVLHPLLLKESRGRWYLIARDVHDENINPYGLDRIIDYEVTKVKYNKEQGIEAAFNDCFGITKPDGEEPQKIRLSFTPFQGNFIKTYPLHQSQTIIQDDENALVIELNLYITHDFIMELLSYGDSIKVLSPSSLKEKIIAILEKSIQNNVNLI